MTSDEIRKHLFGCSVAIAGCGGLGSNAAIALARIGIGELILVDFDRVELSNLNRQYFFRDQIGQFKAIALAENIKRIDPGIRLDVHTLKLDEQNIVKLFGNADLVIEAFDLASAKQMLLETMMQQLSEIPLIIGNGMAGFGGFNNIRQEQWDNRVYICGDFESEISDQNPPLAPRVGIVANMQANLALEILLQLKK